MNMITAMEKGTNGFAPTGDGGNVAGPEPEPEEIPWERLPGRGVFASFVETWVRAIFSPREFFRSFRQPAPGWSVPLAYAVLVGTAGTVLSLPGLYLMGGSWWGDFGFGGGEVTASALLGYLVAAPVVILFRVLISGGALHLCVVLLGGRMGFGSTLRVVAYGESPEMFRLLPWAGGIIAVVAKLVLYYLGFRRVQGLSPFRALFAVAAPFLLLGLITAGLMSAAGFLGTMYR